MNPIQITYSLKGEIIKVDYYFSSVEITMLVNDYGFTKFGKTHLTYGKDYISGFYNLDHQSNKELKRDLKLNKLLGEKIYTTL